LHRRILGDTKLSKIIEIVATSCQILRLKCTKFNFGWSFPRLSNAGEVCSDPSREERGGEGGWEAKGRGEGAETNGKGIGYISNVVSHHARMLSVSQAR